MHRWHELECGNSDAYSSWCLTRGRWTFDGAKFFRHEDEGKPFLERHLHSENKARYSPIADRERGAQKRLAKIMARYPGLLAYVQGDPRGVALYVMARADVPAGSTVDSCYNRGIAVY